MIRIGYGFDSHEFRPGVPCIIGGVRLEHEQGLAGHSDGDVLLHALTDAVWRAFPGHPPFSGKFATVVPHVTVAHGDEPQLCEIEVELRIALASGGGVRARCQDMVLIENSSGRWQEMHRFALGAS